VDDGSADEEIKRILLEYASQNKKIKIKVLPQNQGISNASNEAAALAEGDYIGLLDHDDLLSMDALYEVVKAINEYGADIIYSDEGLIDEAGRYHDSIFKPDFSPDLLFSHNYITHFMVFNKTLFQEVSGFRSICDGAQDYDLVLRLSEKAEKIHHIPKILYLWRKSESSTSLDPSNKDYADFAGKRALEDALFRRNIVGSVEKGNIPFFYRVKRKIIAEPLISIIIPFRDQPVHLKKCIQSILSKTRYSNFEILGIDNGSELEETSVLMKNLEKEDTRVKFLSFPGVFNYSRINNYGVSEASGRILLLLNNDIEVLNFDWLEALLEHAQRDEVGAVGGKLYYPNQTIQHAGVIIGIGGFAGHSHRHMKKDAKGYGNRLNCIQDVSAVSGAMLMIKRKIYVEIGGLDEDNLSVALNDIDFCLRLRQKDYFNIFTPYCEAIHHESASRGYEETPERKMRFQKEIDYFRNKWRKMLSEGDPFYNRNLTLQREDYSISHQKELTEI
jgi:GT2 family glycosyltransferase